MIDQKQMRACRQPAAGSSRFPVGVPGRRLAMAVALLVALLAGCGPESGRPRGGGLGADLGNHARAEIPKSKVFNKAGDGAESGQPPREEQPQH